MLRNSFKIYFCVLKKPKIFRKISHEKNKNFIFLFRNEIKGIDTKAKKIS